MFNKKLKDKIKNLEELNDLLILQAKENSVSAQGVICNILKRGIDWYDYRSLPSEQKLTYYNDAQLILKNEVFNNEIKHLVEDLIKYCATHAKDFEEVKAMRYTINGIELIKERLNSIIDPTRSETYNNLNDAI